ncbi:hypothetical protein [Aquibium microcysteis]|uniref:hypothetical protein n=1 Tax=Aquibium microcysteis TaxID=675281 RepID=UPI00165D2EC9|nr:hypothetical protein [Aquibium microcysteis]
MVAIAAARAIAEKVEVIAANRIISSSSVANILQPTVSFRRDSNRSLGEWFQADKTNVNGSSRRYFEGRMWDCEPLQAN